MRKIYLFLFILLITKIFFSALIGISADEAHYYMYGQFLDGSYLDHPPLVGWFQSLFRSFPRSEGVARIPGIISFLLTNGFATLYFRSRKWSDEIIFYSLLVLNSSFLFYLLTMAFLPDTLLIVFIFPLLMLTDIIDQSFQRRPRLRSVLFMILGILLGLLGLSKYSAVFIPISLLTYIFAYKKTYLIFHKNILWTLIFSLLLITPVLYWNSIHEWASFSYQMNHVVSKSSRILLNPFKEIILQFVAYSPIHFLIAMLGLYSFKKSKDKLAYFIAIPFLFIFLYTSLREVALPHWSLLFYTLMIPYGVYFFLNEVYENSRASLSEKKGKKLFLIMASTFSFFILFLTQWELAFSSIPIGGIKPIHRDLQGWDLAMAEADKIFKAKGFEAIAVPTWSLGSRAMFYSHFSRKVIVLDSHKLQFGIWEKKFFKNPPKKILLVQTQYFKASFENLKSCRPLSDRSSISIYAGKYLVNEFSFYSCDGSEKDISFTN